MMHAYTHTHTVPGRNKNVMFAGVELMSTVRPATVEAQGDVSLNAIKALERLCSVPLFATLGTSKDLADAVENLKVLEFGEGDVVIEQGNRSDAFFVIDRGECIVLRSGVEVSKMRAGESFGGEALLRDTTCAATIVAARHVKCLMMAKQTFTQLIKERENRETIIRGAKLFETFTDDQVARLAGAIERER